MGRLRWKGKWPVNVLPRDKQIQVIAALLEGMSIRSVERLIAVHRDTIMRLSTRIGEACGNLHHAMMQNLQVDVVEVDEQWSYIGKKQKRVKPTDPNELGDSYVFIALGATSKAVLSYAIGKRDMSTTIEFVSDLRSRVVNRPQITADGFTPYPGAIDLVFAGDVDFATIVKTYWSPEGNEAAVRYSPGSIRDIETRGVFGKPDPKKISTSYVERFNLTTRMQMRRFTRLTNGFSKKAANHRAAISLYLAHYNLCRVHEAHRVTPAMQLRVTDHVWSIGELIDAALAAPTAPAPTPTVPRKPMSAAAAKGNPIGGGRLRKLTVIKGGRK